jgi:hypothetical protein
MLNLKKVENGKLVDRMYYLVVTELNGCTYDHTLPYELFTMREIIRIHDRISYKNIYEGATLKIKVIDNDKLDCWDENSYDEVRS